MIQQLEGKVAVITGSASGIGAGVAAAFAREGAHVVINHPDQLQAEAASALAANIGGLAVMADVSTETGAQQLFDAALGWRGQVDILINNAGIAHAGAIEDIAPEQWDRLFAVHVRSAYLMTRLVLPAMRARGWGRIIMTASQLAYKGAAGFSHYAACKGALLSLTRSVALEAGASGVTVNAVAPGATRTPMLADVPEDILETIRAAIPVGRLAEVDDIVPTYVFLASNDARHFQGQCLSPNGGDVFL